MVHVDVEYCGACGHYQKFYEMKEVVLKRVPETKIDGRVGRQASFEVEVDKVLVYSKLKTMAFPDFNEIADIVEEASYGNPIRNAIRQQPIHCSLM